MVRSVAIGATDGELKVNRVALANPLAVPPSPAVAPAFTFGEAAINLSGLGLIEEGDCSRFSSAYVKTRASRCLHLSGEGLHRTATDINLDNCGSLTIEKETDPDADHHGVRLRSQRFAGLDDPCTPDDDGDFGTSLMPGRKPNSGLTNGVFTAAELDIPTGWALTSFVCDDGSDSTPDSINIESNEDVTCVDTNTLQIGAILVHKTAKHADSETGDDPASRCRVQRHQRRRRPRTLTSRPKTDGYGCADGFLDLVCRW